MPGKLSPRISINFQNKLSPRSSPVKSFGSRYKDSARPVWERADIVGSSDDRKNEGQNVLDLESWKNICGKDRSASGTLELIRRHCLGPPLPSSPRYSEYTQGQTSPVSTSPAIISQAQPQISQETHTTQPPRSYETHKNRPFPQIQSHRPQESHATESPRSNEIHKSGSAMISKIHKTRGCSPDATTPERPPRRPYQRCEVLGMGSSIRPGCDMWTGDPVEGQTPDRARKCLDQSFQRAEPQRPSIRRKNSSRNNDSSVDHEFKAFYSSSSSSSRSSSPEPPPPPQDPLPPPDKVEQEFFPPPPGFSTLKRISSECSRTRRQRIRSPLKEQDINNSPLREHAFDLTRSVRKKMEEGSGNPNSPSRTAAKEAAGWEKFHGRRSVSVTLTAEEAEIIRVRRRQEVRRPPSPPHSPVSEEAPPPLPPKPRHKLSEIGSPNSENFIVMDNSAAFSRRASPVMRSFPSFEASTEDSIISRLSPSMGLGQVERGLPELVNRHDEDLHQPTAGLDHQADHQPAELLHCRSDSGLSSMSERTSAMSPMLSLSAPFRATSSSSSSRASVRSSSIVSSCSIPLEEMLTEGEEGGSPRMSEMKVAATNKAILEKVKYFESEKAAATNKAILERVKYFENESSRRKLPVQKRRGTKELKERRDSIKEETVKCVEDEDLDDTVVPEPSQAETSPTTIKDSGVQRQLETIKQQKENLIREIVINENLGLAITEKIEQSATYKEMDKYRIFVTELDKILSLLLSLGSRLQRAEGDLCNKNMTDYEKERIRFHRDKLNRQLGEAQEIKKNSDRRMSNIILFMQKYLTEEEVENFKMYIKQKEELLKMQRAYEDSEKTILHCF